MRGFHPPLPLNAGGILCRGRAPRKEPRATVIAVLSHGFWLGCPKTTPARRRLREAGEGGAILLSAHRALQCRSLAIELALLGLHQAWISPRAPTVVFRRRRTKGVATLTARPWRMAARIVIPVLVVGMIVKWLAESSFAGFARRPAARQTTLCNYPAAERGDFGVVRPRRFPGPECRARGAAHAARGRLRLEIDLNTDRAWVARALRPRVPPWDASSPKWTSRLSSRERALVVSGCLTPVIFALDHFVPSWIF